MSETRIEMTNDQTVADRTYSSPVWLTRLRRRSSVAVRTAIWRARGYLTTHPKWYIALFAILRAIRPIMVLGKFVVVTRHEDVTAILTRDVDFTLAEFSEERMMAGSFLLNIDWPDQHNRESGVVMEAMRRSDAERIRTIAAKRCKTIIDGAKETGNEIDVAGQLAEYVAADVVEEYFGVCVSDDIERAKLISWLRDLASAILTLPPRGSRERAKVEQSAQCLFNLTGALVERRIGELRSGNNGESLRPADGDDVLTRLAKRVVNARGTADECWLNEEWAGRMIAGLVVFGNATIARTATDVLDELLNRPSVLKEATEIVRGNLDSLPEGQANPDDKLKQYIYEALRFRPMLPVLFRYCPRPTVVAYGKRRGRRIPGGASVVAPPIAAMFDGRVFSQPREFKTDRPSPNYDQPLSNYLVFGAGMHKCTGQFVADIELVEIIKAVLALPGLRRSSGGRGQIRYEAAAARSLYLSFDR